jgi:hypothetical protein
VLLRRRRRRRGKTGKKLTRDSPACGSLLRRELRCKEETVDFIERIFHVAPDGGTGSLELAVLLVLVMFPLAVLALRKRRVRSKLTA